MARKEWAAEIMVRLDAEDYGALLLVLAEFPDENRVDVIRELIRIATIPRDTMIRYRLPPDHRNHRLFPDWREWGPWTPIHALERGAHLQRKGYEVETYQVAPAAPQPAWDDDGDDDGDDCPHCDGHEPCKHCR